ncbi:glutamate receptor ionotropic, NMDA 3A-like [Mercenaria mercenaria]|uniref:glutamate receptor ionotropic, NMDA 3A-like n=1 Tax=Mercenaria mercenaria TaxID=6596 RepID=UPI001E1D349B|nr:glutamate receptor ionotropic, NMDA 3A-like [Mercenaria mercenaria]XP_045160469.1 glutamate receptor ionotropic, NMDA 3A-like [Mercenaria mercenaria]
MYCWCFSWMLTALSLFVYGNTLKPQIGIGAIFDAADYTHYNGVFYRGFQENQLLLKHNLSISVRAAPLGGDIYSSLKNLCSFFDGRDVRVVLVVGKEATIQAVGQVAEPLGIPILGYTTDAHADRYVQAHNPLLLMLKPSRKDQANAFLQFFQANFWFNILILVQDLFVADGFYEEIMSKVSAPKWSLQERILPERITNLELYDLVISLLGNEPKLIVIHSELSLAQRIFKATREANLTSLNHAWFVTETSFTHDHDNLHGLPAGSLSIIPNYAVNLEDVILDGTNFMIKSVIKFSNKKAIIRSCWNDSTKLYKSIGKETYRKLVGTKLSGVSGDIVFDNQGNLKANSFVVQNLVFEEGQIFWRKIGHIHGEDVTPFGIIWPGESLSSNIAYGRKRYRIVTNPVKPFVMDEAPHPDIGECAKDTTCIYINNTGKNEIIQALQDYENGIHNESHPYTINCCRGLSLDLLNRLASDLDFDYTLYVVSDYTYGKEINGTWNGMVRELMAGTAHMAVAAFSITRSRVKVIDFTSTYFFSGFSVLYSEKQRASNMQAFLEPFDTPVWFAILISATVAAIAMGLFEWNSPFGLNPWGKKRKQNYTLASGMTMVYSVLFGHTVKTKSPKAWPSKVLQNFWAFSCIFIIASYTANLAAFIAGKHAGLFYNNIHDSRLLDIDVGVLPGSAVEGTVKQLNPRLYTKCQGHLVDTTDNAIDKVIHRNLDAYLGDYPILDYARAKLDPDCKLRLLTQTFGEDGYGIGLPKGSPLKTPLSKMIQNYHESGYIEDLIDVHFADSECYKQRIKQEDSRLEVQHHAGSFVMLCVGIIVGVGVLFLEHGIFKWLVPALRKMPGLSVWKSVHVMFFSQRLHRSITSAHLVPAHETCREMLGIMKNRDFMKLFQKNTIKTSKMADAAKRKRLNRNFFDIIEKAKCPTSIAMKEMQDNNLFGDDSQPSTPAPKITEISLKDITQVVDLNEFRKQNLEFKGNCSNLLLPVKESNVDDCSTNEGFDWTPPQANAHDSFTKDDFDWIPPQKSVHDLSTEILSSCSFPGSYSISDTTEKDSDTDNFDPLKIKGESSSFTTPFFEIEPSLQTISETNPLTAEDNMYDSPSELDPCLPVQNKTPNGDMFSDEYKPKRKELSFSPDACSSRRASGDAGNEVCAPAIRRLSIPETKTKESRTFHPRKRQTVHGNRRDKSQTKLDIEHFSKEELLLMWKSSELELSNKLEAAVKDKQRLETKLNALKLHMSTPV